MVYLSHVHPTVVGRLVPVKVIEALFKEKFNRWLNVNLAFYNQYIKLTRQS